MDREIPKEVRNKERNKKIIRYSSIGVAGIVVIGILISVMRTGVEKKDLVLSTVDKGMIEVSVSASGKVVPAFLKKSSILPLTVVSLKYTEKGRQCGNRYSDSETRPSEHGNGI